MYHSPSFVEGFVFEASTSVDVSSTKDGFYHILEGYFVDAKINTAETTKYDFLAILSIPAVRFFLKTIWKGAVYLWMMPL